MEKKYSDSNVFAIASLEEIKRHNISKYIFFIESLKVCMYIILNYISNVFLSLVLKILEFSFLLMLVGKRLMATV